MDRRIIRYRLSLCIIVTHPMNHQGLLEQLDGIIRTSHGAPATNNLLDKSRRVVVPRCPVAGHSWWAGPVLLVSWLLLAPSAGATAHSHPYTCSPRPTPALHPPSTPDWRWSISAFAFLTPRTGPPSYLPSTNCHDGRPRPSRNRRPGSFKLCAVIAPQAPPPLLELCY